MQFATTSNSSPVTPGKFKIAVAQESPQSIREFTKQIQVRDQTECKETFKAIKNATTDAEKNAILDQALEYLCKGLKRRVPQSWNRFPKQRGTRWPFKEKELRAKEKERWSGQTNLICVRWQAFNDFKVN